ncbi:MAG: hypothetical protein ACK5DL_03105, partial [Burkholderiales bacterium]
MLVEQSAMAQRLPIYCALARRASKVLESLRSHLDQVEQSNIAKKALAAGVRISNCCTHHCPDLPSVSLRQVKQNAACGRGCSTSIDSAIKYGELFPRAPVKPSWIETKKMRGNFRPMLNTRNANKLFVCI